MSTSLSVKAFREPNEEFNKKIAAYRALEAANEEIPDSLSEYFNWEEPDENGTEIELPLTEWSNDHAEGYELKVSDMPKGINVIRFYLS